MTVIAITAVPRTVPTAFGRRDADTTERGLVHGVIAAGAAPIVLPVVPPALADEQLRHVDGLVLSGGQDLDADVFGIDRHPESTWVDPQRDQHEIALWRAAQSRGIPVLGICRGLQLAAQLSGGILEPHIENHYAGERYKDVRHPITVTPGSQLARVLGAGEEPQVNTIHHQAVRAIPDRWTVVATAADGTIEAAESAANGWFLGVQWHPELMLDEPAGQPVFDALAAVAA